MSDIAYTTAPTYPVGNVGNVVDDSRRRRRRRRQSMLICAYARESFHLVRLLIYPPDGPSTDPLHAQTQAGVACFHPAQRHRPTRAKRLRAGARAARRAARELGFDSSQARGTPNHGAQLLRDSLSARPSV